MISICTFQFYESPYKDGHTFTHALTTCPCPSLSPPAPHHLPVPVSHHLPLTTCPCPSLSPPAPVPVSHHLRLTTCPCPSLSPPAPVPVSHHLPLFQSVTTCPCPSLSPPAPVPVSHHLPLGFTLRTHLSTSEGRELILTGCTQHVACSQLVTHMNLLPGLQCPQLHHHYCHTIQSVKAMTGKTFYSKILQSFL